MTNPGLKRCTCCSQRSTVSLLDFDTRELEDFRDDRLPLVFRATTHTFARSDVTAEITRRNAAAMARGRR
jgi:hypothetical protein